MLRADKLRYIGGLKYRSTEPYWAMCNLRPRSAIVLNRINLTREGLFFVEGGYSSDGPSGPTIDTKDFMPAAMGWHDPVYELLRHEMMHVEISIIQPDFRPGEGYIYTTDPDNKIIRNATHEEIRQEADRFLADILLLDGMWKFRVKYIYDSLRAGGTSSAITSKKVHVAP